MNGVRPNGYYQPEALQKRSRERAGEVGDRRLEASVTNGADGAFRIRRVMVEKSAEQSKNEQGDQGRSHCGRAECGADFSMTVQH
jgi:hypothetical protein